MNHIACYTSIAGGYDTLKEHPEVFGVDWICFTDSETPKRTGWEMRSLSGFSSTFNSPWSPRMMAKWYKVHPHLCLPEYEDTIWIDGSITVTDARFVAHALGGLMKVFAHPERDDIYEEAVASLDFIKYRDANVLEQAAHYRRQGHPRHFGLWACGVIARHRDPRIDQLMKVWWNEIVTWSEQDQISFAEVMRMYAFKPTLIPGSIYDAKHMKLELHPDAL